MQLSGTDEVLVRQSGTAGRITLNRPRALNALTLDMLRSMAAALDQWDGDPSVSVVLLDGAGPRGFCAGGDIRAIYQSGRARDGLAETFWREEYHLIARIARFPKPVVTFMSGLVMGGGVGLSAHSSHRVVTETAAVAMPEVGIGLIPDVGGTWLFAHAPGEVGTYLALTGKRMEASDVIEAGFADFHVLEAQLPEVSRALQEVLPSPDAAAEVESILRSYARPAGASPLFRNRASIDSLFCFDELESIVDALAAASSDFAVEAHETIQKMSPTSLKVTLAALRRARSLTSLEACLDLEYRIVCRVLDNHDFYEGVRAAVIDKDRRPRWQPDRLESVTADIIERHFAPLGSQELGLARSF